ncbi:MAG: hypothetical protein PHW34_02025 [Hespellia sp.]|nr:hypothetical protein [Hespellia sp.]
MKEQQLKTFSEIIKLPVVEMKTGKNEGKTKQIIINPEQKQLYLVLESEKINETRLLNCAEIGSIGEDYLLIRDESCIHAVSEEPELSEEIQTYFSVCGLKAVSVTGNTLGVIEDFEVDYKNGRMGNIMLDNGQSFDSARISELCELYAFIDIEKIASRPQSQTAERHSDIIAIHSLPTPEKSELDTEEALTLADMEDMKMTESVQSKDGAFFVEKGTILTSEIVKEAEAHDALVDVAMHAE